jgi:hypothetical protein
MRDEIERMKQKLSGPALSRKADLAGAFFI